MRISGIQKLTLLDYPGTVACTMFTSGCNFRCPFCHNALLVLPERIEESFLTEEEIMNFLKKRFGVLDGIAVTGGEPLIHSDMPQLLRKIKDIGYKVKLDTNGSNPALLKEIIDAGLVDRVAMDIKNAPEAYGETIGIPGFDISRVEESKNLLLQGNVEYEFRTTVVKGIHTKESLVKAAKWIEGANEYYLQQFKDSGDLILPEGLGAYDKEEMNDLCNAVRQYVPAAQVRGV